jgi:transposase
MRKGQGSLITVVSDIEGGNLIEMIDSHRQEDIVEAVIQQPFEVREQVEEVSVDMWGGFPSRYSTSIPKCTSCY